jgi:hypothetical protein
MRTSSLLMICALSLTFVPMSHVLAGTCFLWGAGGTSDCYGNMTAAECSTAQADGLWSHGYFIPNPCSGCTTITDDQGSEKLPYECAGQDTFWRYLVCVGCGLNSNPPPHEDPPESWCELGSDDVCWERQILYKCKITWAQDT